MKWLKDISLEETVGLNSYRLSMGQAKVVVERGKGEVITTVVIMIIVFIFYLIDTRHQSFHLTYSSVR